MAKYETLHTITLHTDTTFVPTNELPELVHLEDPAISVFCDFAKTQAVTIQNTHTMDEALHEMKLHNTHLLLVKSEYDNIQGIVTTEDVLGEKPIRLIQQRRLPREKVVVKMLMQKIHHIPTIMREQLRHIKVGHIVNTLTAIAQPLMLVARRTDNDPNKFFLCGIFMASQINRQLHEDARIHEDALK